MVQLLTSSYRAFIKIVLIILVVLAQYPPYTAVQDDSDYAAVPADSTIRIPHRRKDIAVDKIKVNKTVAITVASLIGAFFITGCVSVFVAKHCIRRELPLESHGVPAAIRRRLFGRPVPAAGIDGRIIGTFPTFVYSEVKKDGISPECAVCLSEFKNTETLRMLPKCCHVFHHDCIASWLSTHVTRPVCRANLAHEPDPVGISDSDRRLPKC